MQYDVKNWPIKDILDYKTIALHNALLQWNPCRVARTRKRHIEEVPFIPIMMKGNINWIENVTILMKLSSPAALKVVKSQLSVQPMMKISAKWQHFCFGDEKGIPNQDQWWQK